MSSEWSEVDPIDAPAAEVGPTNAESSFTSVFARALLGEPTTVVGMGDTPRVLPVSAWTRAASPADLRILALCEGTTLDIGCGPGRLTGALSELGHLALGIDVVEQAVELTRDRGAEALHRDVFEALPGEGRWQTALLADGNVGIGGDPIALLSRVRDVVGPGGRIVVELSGLGVRSFSGWVSLQGLSGRSRPFRWAVVSVDAADVLARSVGLLLDGIHQIEDRWAVVLRKDSE